LKQHRLLVVEDERIVGREDFAAQLQALALGLLASAYKNAEFSGCEGKRMRRYRDHRTPRATEERKLS
jgi:hypothetical protein